MGLWQLGSTLRFVPRRMWGFWGCLVKKSSSFPPADLWELVPMLRAAPRSRFIWALFAYVKLLLSLVRAGLFSAAWCSAVTEAKGGESGIQAGM